MKFSHSLRWKQLTMFCATFLRPQKHAVNCLPTAPTCLKAIDCDMDVVTADATRRPVSAVRPVIVCTNQHVLARSTHHWCCKPQLLKRVVLIRLKETPRLGQPQRPVSHRDRSATETGQPETGQPQRPVSHRDRSATETGQPETGQPQRPVSHRDRSATETGHCRHRQTRNPLHTKHSLLYVGHSYHMIAT